MLPILTHAFSHGTVRQLTHETLEVLVELFETIDLTAFLQSFFVDCFQLGKNFFTNDCLCLCDLHHSMFLQNGFKLWVLLCQFSHFFFGLLCLRNTKYHMQHFFIEGTGTLEGRPHLDLHVCLLLIFGITLWKSYELFDESDEMFLEVVENRFFPSRCLSFIDWRVA